MTEERRRYCACGFDLCSDPPPPRTPCNEAVEAVTEGREAA